MMATLAQQIAAQIKAWRIQAGLDRIYQLRGAARKAKLAELQALADQLKAAQKR
jgi:hypothetical protein